MVVCRGAPLLVREKQWAVQRQVIHLLAEDVLLRDVLNLSVIATKRVIATKVGATRDSACGKGRAPGWDWGIHWAAATFGFGWARSDATEIPSDQ